MARLIFPDDQVVLRPGPPNATIRNAAGATAVVYANTTGMLADITQLDGTPVPSATLTVDTYSRLPLFKGPDAIDTLYVSVDSGPLTAIYARVDDRLDALQTQLDSLSTTVSAISAGGGPVSASSVSISGAAGTSRELRYLTGTSWRWTARANGTAETGSNGGSDYTISRYDDSGNWLDDPFAIDRNTGRVRMNYLDALTGALGIATPRNHGLVAWTYDPGVADDWWNPTSGQVLLSAIFVPRNASVTKLYWGISNTGSLGVAGQNFVGLYNSSGARLANVNIDGRVQTAGLYAETISATLTPGQYWVAWVFNCTSNPGITGASVQGATGLHNAGISSPSQYRCAVGATGQTSLPASLTPSSFTHAAINGWAAVG